MSAVDRQGAPAPSGAVAVAFASEAGHTSLLPNLNDLKTPPDTVKIFEFRNQRYEALNVLVERALAGPAYWIWFINENHSFEPEIIETLLQRNEAMVAPISVDSIEPYYPRAWTDVADDGGTKPFLLNQVVGPATMVEVRGANVTGMLVRRAVFEAMGRPWFRRTETMAEDVYFCERAKELGFQTYVDTSSRLSTRSSAQINPVHRGDRWELSVEVGDNMKFALPLKHR